MDSVNPQDHPREFSDEEWMERIQHTHARYLDILGWVQFLSGDAANAIHTLQSASEQILDPGLLYHLAQVYDSQSQWNEAIDHYARVTAFGGELATLSHERLTALWQQTGNEESQLSALLDRYQDDVADTHRQKILDRRLSQKAPELELARLNGGQVRLSNLKGTPVLLCFWGTWSDASVNLLEILDKMTASGSRTELLTVSVDKDHTDISRFIRKYRVRYPVLRMNAETARRWKIRGVPMLFVIDSDGIIRFIHKGYRPDIEQVHIAQRD